jgi:predicted DNA-binding antitoxin AbrB/MazE fold protein
MSKTLRAMVREGRIELLEPVDLPEGTKLLVTLLPDEEAEFWLSASQVSLDTLWDNPEDDVYGQLLKE